MTFKISAEEKELLLKRRQSTGAPDKIAKPPAISGNLMKIVKAVRGKNKTALKSNSAQFKKVMQPVVSWLKTSGFKVQKSISYWTAEEILVGEFNLVYAGEDILILQIKIDSYRGNVSIRNMEGKWKHFKQKSNADKEWITKSLTLFQKYLRKATRARISPGLNMVVKSMMVALPEDFMDPSELKIFKKKLVALLEESKK
jgi:hypothetical protein